MWRWLASPRSSPSARCRSAQPGRTAHVAGEPVLSLCLVRELSRRGVRCFVATTERNVVRDEAGPGEERRIERAFKFVRWREYPVE